MAGGWSVVIPQLYRVGVWARKGSERELAEDFRGWSGERTWRSVNRELRVTATHHSGGHVGLCWTLAEPHWELSVAVTVDAGEDMRRLASEVLEAERDD